MEATCDARGGCLVIKPTDEFGDGGESTVLFRSFRFCEYVEQLVRDGYIASFRESVHDGDTLVGRHGVKQLQKDWRGGGRPEFRECGDIFEGDGRFRFHGGIDESLFGGSCADGGQCHDGIWADSGIAELGGDHRNLRIVRAEAQQLENCAFSIVILYFFRQAVRKSLRDDVTIRWRVGDKSREGVCSACIFR